MFKVNNKDSRTTPVAARKYLQNTSEIQLIVDNVPYFFQFFTSFYTKCLLREKYRYSEFFWSVFSRIEYGEIRRISSYSDRMRENTDQKNSDNRHFSRSDEENSKVWGTSKQFSKIAQKD